MTIHYTEEQEDAIALACDTTKRIVGVTGAAGTGKTTILKAAYEQINCEDPFLCAPTGRAAKRIQEATGIKASTIHRMMRYSMPDDDDDVSLPAHDSKNPLPYMAVFIDEASMVSDDLYRAIIDALKPGAVVRFFGDANQLPPVNSKSPFMSILEKWPSVTLHQNFRSTDGIISASQNILNGKSPQANDKFTMINPGTAMLMNAADEFIDDAYRGFGKQIIIPTKKGKYGTWVVNRYVQNKLNRNAQRIRLVYEEENGDKDERVFGIGDKVIHTKNDYQLRLMNGQIGHVSHIDNDDGTIVVTYDDREYVYPAIMEVYDEKRGRSVFKYDPRKNLELAYAITTHKAQGSEFDTVLLMLNRSYVLNRANFYTAVTRAKEKVICLLGPGSLMEALKKAPELR